MTIGNVQSTVESSSYTYSAKRTTNAAAENVELCDSLELQTGKSESGIIGMTMIPYGDSNTYYGISARYAEDSTAENPIIQVVSDYGGQTTIYNVNINDVDPSNATMLEMFAFLSYADDQGLTNAGTFGSFQQLKVYAGNASLNGYFDEVSGLDFVHKKLDWTNAVENIGQDYLDAGLHQQFQSSQYLLQFLQDKIVEMQANIEAGNVDNEPVFQIGAQAYTEEEWDKLLEYVDDVEKEVQEAIDAEKEEQLEEVRENMGAEQKEKLEEVQESEDVTQTTTPETNRTEGAEEVEETTLIEKAESTLLTAEYTECTFSSQNPNDKGWKYVTWYTEEGMYCEDVNGHVGNNWMLFWENDEQYDKVMEFINQFPDDFHMLFACNQTFWKDFLNDEIDMEAFMEFMETTDNGIPNYLIGDEESMYVDKEKVEKWAKYTNQPGWFRPLERLDEFGNVIPDKQYTDERSGFKWYVNIHGEPYMLGNSAEDFYRHCKKTGADPAKKFAELTGMLQYLPDGSYAYIGSNGISIKSDDGEKLFVDKEDMTYDMLMYMFDNLPATDDYFNLKYWQENMAEAKEAVPKEEFFKYEPKGELEKVYIDPKDIVYQ